MKITIEAYKKARNEMAKEFRIKCNKIFEEIKKKHPFAYYGEYKVPENVILSILIAMLDDGGRNERNKKINDYILDFFKYMEKDKDKMTYYLDPTETVDHFCDVWFKKLMSNKKFFNSYLRGIDLEYGDVDINIMFAICKKLNASASEIYDFITEIYWEDGKVFSIIREIRYHLKNEFKLDGEELLNVLAFIAHNYVAVAKRFFKKLLPYIYAYSHKIFYARDFNMKEICCKEKLEFPDAVDCLTEEEIKEYLHV